MIIAANRDEFYARSSQPPRYFHTQSHKHSYYAGIDSLRGGTWMGATTKGFVVGITNQRPQTKPRKAPFSRGEVVKTCLELGKTRDVLQYLQQIEASKYNPFNLIFGDIQGLFVAYVHGKTPIVQSIPHSHRL